MNPIKIEAQRFPFDSIRIYIRILSELRLLCHSNPESPGREGKDQIEIAIK
jgi:hypothetical protein